MTNNPKNRQQWIFDLLKVEQLNYVETWARFGQKWAKGKTTFDIDWKKANEKLNAYQNKANKAKEDASIAHEVKALESGLKTKLDRQLFYQNQIIELEKMLTGETKFSFIVQGKFFQSHKGDVYNVPIEKQNEIREQIKSFQTELSKMTGDYTANKVDHTTNGNDMTPISITLDLS